MSTTFFRLSASTINSIRQNSPESDADFCSVGGTLMTVKFGNEDGEPPETRTYRSVDGTHWEDEEGGAFSIWHSAQMSDYLHNPGLNRHIIGIAIEDEFGKCIFRMGHPW